MKDLSKLFINSCSFILLGFFASNKLSSNDFSYECFANLEYSIDTCVLCHTEPSSELIKNHKHAPLKNLSLRFNKKKKSGEIDHFSIISNHKLQTEIFTLKIINNKYYLENKRSSYVFERYKRKLIKVINSNEEAVFDCEMV